MSVSGSQSQLAPVSKKLAENFIKLNSELPISFHLKHLIYKVVNSISSRFANWAFSWITKSEIANYKERMDTITRYNDQLGPDTQAAQQATRTAEAVMNHFAMK